MSARNRTKTNSTLASDPQTAHRATRAELRHRYELRDLRDALNEARGLIHFDRVLASA
ncbi:hypothetical protein [Dactylosporangium salmoneum]|uniref:Uncharacterized protein n=1 Tax=Dactylosporangium salmoneum TaxID=53361 RepID=A0ABP5TA57_9ACTN